MWTLTRLLLQHSWLSISALSYSLSLLFLASQAPCLLYSLFLKSLPFIRITSHAHNLMYPLPPPLLSPDLMFITSHTSCFLDFPTLELLYLILPASHTPCLSYFLTLILSASHIYCFLYSKSPILSFSHTPWFSYSPCLSYSLLLMVLVSPSPFLSYFLPLLLPAT
jgi:hypothetical protein